MNQTEHLRFEEKPDACPNCGHSPVAEIHYGLPAFDEELERALKSGLVTLGGCCVTGDDPAWECLNCEWQGWETVVQEED